MRTRQRLVHGATALVISAGVAACWPPAGTAPSAPASPEQAPVPCRAALEPAATGTGVVSEAAVTHLRRTCITTHR
jgi:hypothetical protein